MSLFRRAFASAFPLLCLAMVGCSRTDNFQIQVRNETTGALTIALTKDGPPFEKLWASPEELAIESPHDEEQHGYVVLPPGRDAAVAVQGKFDSNSHGVLRVYRGDLQVSDMNAVGPRSSNRLDLQLQAGPNIFVIGEEQGRLVRKHRSAPVDAAPPAGAGATTHP